MKLHKLTPYVLIIGLILSINAVMGQKSLYFLNLNTDVGKVDNWANHPAEFLIVNQGTTPQAILKADFSSDLKIYFKRNYIKPGDTAIVQAYYIPKEPGPFKRSFRIYLSDRKSHITLRFSGDVYSMDDCPDFSIPGGRKPPERLLVVEDKISGLRIDKADVELIMNDRKEITGKTNRKGEVKKDLKPGLYEIIIRKDGYHPYFKTFYLNYRTHEIKFLITPELKPYIADSDLNYEDDDISVPIDIPPSLNSEIPEYVVVGRNDPTDDDGDFMNGELSRQKYAENNIVLLLDVSSSMRSGGKLDLLKLSIAYMIDHLREIDRVSVITYASRQTLIFEGVNGSRKDTLYAAINALKALGSTYGIAGMNKAYEIAKQNFLDGGNNQLIVATDGEFNSPAYSDKKLEDMILEQKDSGIKLSIMALGSDAHSIDRMKKASSTGGGNFISIDKNQVSEELLLEEIMQQSRKQ